MPTSFTGLGAAKPNQKYYNPVPTPQLPDYQDYLGNLFSGRQQSLASQAKLLQQYGSSLRNLVLQNNPEMQNLSNYLNERMAAPIAPGMLDEYRQNFRQAAAGQGWGQEVGGPAVASQEAGYISRLQEKARADLVPQVLQFNNQLLGMTGLVPQPFGAQEVSAGMGMANQAAMQMASFQSQQNQYQLEQYAAAKQSDWSRQQYEETKRQMDAWEQYNKQKIMRQDAFKDYMTSGQQTYYPKSPSTLGWGPAPPPPYFWQTVPPTSQAYRYDPRLGF